MEYELYHYGILGMHWGIRRYQNRDGSLTTAGKKRYGGDKGKTKLAKDVSQITARINKLESKPQSDKNNEEIEFLKKMRKALSEETVKYYDSFINDNKTFREIPVKSISKYDSFSDDEKKFRELSKKSVSELSTSDIQFMNTRIQAKNAYASNTESKALKFIRTTTSQVASQLATEYLKAGTKKIISWSGEKLSNFYKGNSAGNNSNKNNTTDNNTKGNSAGDNRTKGKKKNKKGK